MSIQEGNALLCPVVGPKSENQESSSWLAEQESRLDSGDEGTAEYAEENDWDEYADEIASAVAFASLKESEINRRAWEADDGEVDAV